MRYNIRSVSSLQILVESVPLRDELLLPLSESLLLDLDLLREPLAQGLFLLLELGVVQFPGPRLAKLPRLHLLRAVRLVVLLLCGMDQVQHVRADEDRTELPKVAVLFLLDFGHTPGVLTALDDLSLVVLDVLLRSNHGEGHSGHQAASVVGRVLIVVLHRWRVDLDALGLDNILDLLVSMIAMSRWKTYSLLELSQVGRAEGVRLGDDGNQIDTRAQPFHHLNVERFQGVSRGSDEVEASVHPHIDLVRTTGLLLLEHVRLMLVVQELDDGLP